MDRLLTLGLLLSIGSLAHSQFASLFDKAQQADNCQTWSEWGNCVWVKGSQTRNKTGYFSQLSDTCQRNGFFAMAKNTYGQALDNVYSYLKDISKDDDACGLCSYRHSCGSMCDARNRGSKYVNRIFVAEERCNELQLDGNDQLTACYSDYDKIIQYGNEECKVWPNRNIPLPNVPEMYKSLLYAVPLFNCVKAKDDKKNPVCRCCCAPYVPSPEHQYLCIDPQQRVG